MVVRLVEGTRHSLFILLLLLLLFFFLLRVYLVFLHSSPSNQPVRPSRHANASKKGIDVQVHTGSVRPVACQVLVYQHTGLLGRRGLWWLINEGCRRHLSHFLWLLVVFEAAFVVDVVDDVASFVADGHNGWLV